MSIFDMFKFWKKHDEFDLGSDLTFGADKEAGAKPDMPDFGHLPDFSRPEHETRSPEPSASSPSSHFEGFGQSSPFAAAPLQSSQQASSADLQLISAKLDTIRVMLENLSARLQHLEQKQESEGVQLVQGRSQARWNY